MRGAALVVDGRAVPAALSPAQYRAVGDRRRGVGYDQFLTILPARNGGAAYMAIHNPDGSEAQACGNGTRCVASLLMREAGTAEVAIETVAGRLLCTDAGDGRVTVVVWTDRALEPPVRRVQGVSPVITGDLETGRTQLGT